MKKLATVIAVAGLIGTPAFAADMAVKSAPPAPAPAPVYNWTGWYIGVNAGASMGSAKIDINAPPITVEGEPGPGVSLSDRLQPDGFIGGGQIGYNWQYSPLIVVGLEADFQGALERDSRTDTGSFNFIDPCGCHFEGTTNTSLEAKIDWFGTVRGRLGYVWGNGQVLSYVTGGFAYGRVELEGTTTISGTFDSETPFSDTGAFSHSNVNTGWTLGYGTEGALDFWGAHNWTWK